MQLCLKDWVLVDVPYWRSHCTYVKNLSVPLPYSVETISCNNCLPPKLLTTPSGQRQYLVNLCPQDLAWTWCSSGCSQYFPRGIAFEWLPNSYTIPDLAMGVCKARPLFGDTTYNHQLVAVLGDIWNLGKGLAVLPWDLASTNCSANASDL